MSITGMNNNNETLTTMPSDDIDLLWKSQPYEQFYNKVEMNGKAIGYLHQLIQLLRIVSDGDLISKSHRDSLYSHGLIIRVEGWQVISEKGIRYLNDLGIIKP